MTSILTFHCNRTARVRIFERTKRNHGLFSHANWKKYLSTLYTRKSYPRLIFLFPLSLTCKLYRAGERMKKLFRHTSFNFTRRAILLSLSRKHHRKKYHDCRTSQEQVCLCVKRVLFETYLLSSTVSGTHTSSGDRLISSIQPYSDLFQRNSGSNQACIGKEAYV